MTGINPQAVEATAIEIEGRGHFPVAAAIARRFAQDGANDE